jgi:hypothetical protein
MARIAAFVIVSVEDGKRSTATSFASSAATVMSLVLLTFVLAIHDPA